MNALNTRLPETIPLWPAGEIEIIGQERPEEYTTLPNGLKVVRNVTQPTLTAFLPEPAQANGTAVIVAPGGAYHFLAYEHEGTDVARWLNARGIAAFLLKYRVTQTGDDFPEVIERTLRDPEKMAVVRRQHFPLITADGCQAVRLVRERAGSWGVNPGRVGMMGFSAGGMATLGTVLHSDPSSRPDFAAPIYSASPAESPVPADAPPLFLLCANDDEMAVGTSRRYYEAWRSAGHPVELHIYAQGGHGFGMNRQGLPCDDWIELFAGWLKGQRFL